jgi:hypothetical protein
MISREGAREIYREMATLPSTAAREVAVLAETILSLYERIEELEAQVKRVDDQITEELTHGPIATYYALRFRAALAGEVQRS